MEKLEYKSVPPSRPPSRYQGAMPRKYSSDSSDDGLPELDDFIDTHVKKLHALDAPTLNPSSRPLILASPTRTLIQQPSRKTSPCKQPKDLELDVSRKRLGVRSSRNNSERAKLDLPATRLVRPLSEISLSAPLVSSRARATPHRRAKQAAETRAVVDLTAESEEESIYLTAESDEDKAEVEGGIWCDSDDDSKPELPRGNAFLKLKELQPRRFTPDTELSGSDSDDLDSNIFKSRSPRKALTTYKSPAKLKNAPSFSTSAEFSDKENARVVDTRLPSPTALYPSLPLVNDRPSTPPPTSPTKSKLVSPSKKKPRVPTPPHRPSLDAFWNSHDVNDWNDQYSPQKPVVSPKKSGFLPRHDSAQSPSSSPRKSLSPTKRTRAEIDAKKDFDSRKHKLCEDFFAELDKEVTQGKIRELAESAGGVRFVWSKTLNSTAGRANWKKETKKAKDASGEVITTYKHHASIELAEKVIDDEERLLNVVAHEFCHLANFMVSGIKDQPHGRQFKAWGAKCTKAFGHRGVEVTTKHSYQIDYKYIWSCTSEMCGHEFKRHSKSIDPARHTCGKCRGKLIQVKPVPRKQGGKAGPGAYAAFVKEHFATIKKDMAGAPHKEVMTALGQRYREQKAAAAATATAVGEGDVNDVARALEVVTLD